MFDTVAWVQFGLVSRPSPSPVMIYTEATENTPQSSDQGYLVPSLTWLGLLVCLCAEVGDEANTNTLLIHEGCVAGKITIQLATQPTT